MAMPLDQYFNGNGNIFYSVKGHNRFEFTDFLDKNFDKSQFNYKAWYQKNEESKILLRTQILKKQ